MENEVWSEISAFLNNLRCGDVSRKSYLHFPELEEADKIRKVKKANFETEMRKLNAEQRQQIENYLEAVQHLAFMEEERACHDGRSGPVPGFDAALLKTVWQIPVPMSAFHVHTLVCEFFWYGQIPLTEENRQSVY